MRFWAGDDGSYNHVEFFSAAGAAYPIIRPEGNNEGSLGDDSYFWNHAHINAIYGTPDLVFDARAGSADDILMYADDKVTFFPDNQTGNYIQVYQPGGGQVGWAIAGDLYWLATGGDIFTGANWGIGRTTAPGYLLEMEASNGGYYDVSDHDWHTGASLREVKTEPSDWQVETLSLLKDIRVRRFQYKDLVTQYDDANNPSLVYVEPSPDKPYAVGFVTEELPEGIPLEVINEDGHLSMRGAFTFLLKAIQEQQGQIEELEAKIEVLKAKVNGGG
jgi:hypothetical protein